jgi:hypothetical protein
MRLAAGDGKIAEVEDEGEIAGTITFVHTSGYVHTVSVDLQALRAAQGPRWLCGEVLQRSPETTHLGSPEVDHVRNSVSRSGLRARVDRQKRKAPDRGGDRGLVHGDKVMAFSRWALAA